MSSSARTPASPSTGTRTAMNPNGSDRNASFGLRSPREPGRRMRANLSLWSENSWAMVLLTLGWVTPTVST
ncbi:hypothetical protein ACWCP8_28085 [Streptomyces sp. NPDC002206]